MKRSALGQGKLEPARAYRSYNATQTTRQRLIGYGLYTLVQILPKTSAPQLTYSYTFIAEIALIQSLWLRVSNRRV